VADKKISALTGASTPLAGTEVLPIVQSGSTVKVSVDNLTAGRDMSAGNVTTTKNIIFGASYAGGSFATDYLDGRYLTSRIFNVPSGSSFVFAYAGGDGVTFSSAGDITPNIGNFKPIAGKGIDFSANSHAAGMTSELLNWYEEGTWTGTLTGDVAAPTTPITVSGRYTRIGRQVTVQISLFNVNTTGASGVMLITGLPFASSAERAYGSCFFIGMGSAVATAHIQSADNRISFLDAVTGAYINISAGAGKYVGASITYTV